MAHASRFIFGMKKLAAIFSLVAVSASYIGEPTIMPDVAYRAGMSRPILDFYAPATKGFATVVHVYDSGWRSGSGRSSMSVAEHWMHDGIGCVLVTHRLAPAHTIREQASDVAAAFAWAKNHVAEYGGDPKKIFLVGHGAGGQLALLVAAEPSFLAAEHLSPADIAGVIGLSAIVDLVPRTDGRGYGNSMSGPAGRGVFPSDPKEIPKLSPLHQLKQKLPRTLLLVGSDDFPMLAADMRNFAEKARSFGTDISTDVVAEKDHLGMIQGMRKENDPVFVRVLAFVRPDSPKS